MIRAMASRTTAVLTATMLAGTLLLSGCASPTVYSEETAQDLQQRVLAVTDAAAGADYPAAKVRIDELRAAANDALARGDISDERHAAIVSALDLVESDVDAALAAKAAAAAEAARLAEEQRLAEEAAVAAEAARLAEEQEKQDNEDKRGRDKDEDD